jgi:predicted nucleic acid-binding Zn ribbon protein
VNLGDGTGTGTGPVGLPIGEATRRLLRARGLESTATLGDVLSAWDEVVGAPVAAHAQPRSLHGAVLTIEVDEPVWATQMQFLSGTILEGLSQRLGDRAPTSLNVRVARPGQGARGVRN